MKREKKPAISIMLDATGTTEQKPGNASHGHVKPALLHENWKRKTKKINIAKLFRARRGALIDSHEQDQKINESILASVQDPSPEVSMAALRGFAAVSYNSTFGI